MKNLLCILFATTFLNENMKYTTNKAIFERETTFVKHVEHTLLNRAKSLLLLGYHKQGLAQAALLRNDENSKVSGQAEALIISYSI